MPSLPSLPSSFARRAVAMVAALASTWTPWLAQAQANAEYKVYVPGLVVTGSSSLAPGVPTAQAVVSLSAQTVDFGAVATHTSQTREVLVSNVGTGALTFTAPAAVTGAAAFAAGLTSCGGSLEVGADCLAQVLFSPVASGTFNGTLAFTTALANSPHQVTLVGTAFNPVSLASALLPQATKGQAYSYDFKPLLSVSNEATPDKAQATWSASGALPAGLSLNATTGVLSGTPTAMSAAADYTVTGTYKNNQGQQVYVISVAGVSTSAVQLMSAGGGGFTCVVTELGGVKCWGSNLWGQLGDGTNVDKIQPVEVSGLNSGVASIYVGSGHVCALMNAGGVKCWGYNTSGQLGDNSVTNRNRPVDVLDLGTDVVAVRAGGAHTCAVLSGNQARCWGDNTYGQLGVGNTTSTRRPGTGAAPLTNIADLQAGGTNTCAVTSAGAALCWGQNNYGQLGIGAVSTYRSSPTAVSGLSSGVAKVIPSKYYYATCAVMASGVAKCWGYNEYGQVGNGVQSTQQTTPVDVQGLSANVAHIEIQQYHACALTTAGGVKCWGGNGTLAGRLGDGSGSALSLTPVEPVGLSSGVTHIGVARDISCALLSTGSVKCWGYNVNGAVGDGTKVNRPTPVAVSL